MLNDLINGESSNLVDSKSIRDIFHNNGVNMRYLGIVLNKLDKVKHVHIKYALERVILVKSLKHVCRSIMRDSNKIHLLYNLAHLLNCIFASNSDKKILDNKEVIFKFNEKEQKIEVNNDNNSDNLKKKKKKKKKNVVVKENSNQFNLISYKINLENSEFLFNTPQEIWEKITNIANKRYSYELTKKWEDFSGLNLPFNKIAILRDFCINVGLQIKGKSFEIFENENKVFSKYCELPFCTDDIINIVPIQKSIEINSEDIISHMEMVL